MRLLSDRELGVPLHRGNENGTKRLQGISPCHGILWRRGKSEKVYEVS